MGQRYVANGEGRIIEVERGKRYRIRFQYKDTAKQEWHQAPQRTIKGKKAQAQAELVKYMEEFIDKLNNPDSAATVAEYARSWQETRKALGKYSPTTYERDEIEVKRIEKHFSDVRIVDLTAGDIERMCVKLKKEGLSDSGLHKFYGKLSQILKDATRKQVIPVNPCTQMEPVSRPKSKEPEPLTEEQAVELAKILRDAPREGRIVAVWLALAFGVRRGEALGVRWCDVNLDKFELHVVNQYDKNHVLRPPKNSSQRALAMDLGTADFLANWKEIQSLEYFEGGEVPDDFPVCCGERGGFLDPDTFSRWYRRYMVECGFAKFGKVTENIDSKGVKRYHRTGYVGPTFHALRHTQATLLIGKGEDPKTVQKRMGHSSISVTMNIYAHAIAENERKAAETIGSILG